MRPGRRKVGKRAYGDLDLMRDRVRVCPRGIGTEAYGLPVGKIARMLNL